MILGKANQKKAQEERDRLIDYKRTFGTPEGKRVLFDLMNRYHVLSGHGGDPHKEGQRSVVLRVMADCHVSIQRFDEMLKGEYAE